MHAAAQSDSLKGLSSRPLWSRLGTQCSERSALNSNYLAGSSRKASLDIPFEHVERQQTPAYNLTPGSLSRT